MGYQLAQPDDAQRVISYLSEDMGNCLYIYMDIKEYGIGGDVIDVWLQKEDDRIISVLMRYADGFQVYAREDDASLVDFEGARSIMVDGGWMRLMGPKCLIEQFDALLGVPTKTFYGTVFELVKHRPMKAEGIVVEEATAEDIPEIVDLLFDLMPDMQVGHDRDATIRAFINRLENGSGKNWIIRVDGKIAAHESMSASCDDAAVLSHKITAREFRTYPYAAVLDSYLYNVALPAMGKRGFGFIIDERIYKQLKLTGNPIVGEYGFINRLD